MTRFECPLLLTLPLGYNKQSLRSKLKEAVWQFNMHLQIIPQEMAIHHSLTPCTGDKSIVVSCPINLQSPRLLHLQHLRDRTDVFWQSVSACIDVHGSVANWSSGQIIIHSIQISLIIFCFSFQAFKNEQPQFVFKKYTRAIYFWKLKI